MSMQLWRNQHQDLLGEVELEHIYSDEVRSPGRPLRELFGDRPQVRKNNAPHKVSRTVPAWFLVDDAVQKFLMLRFINMPRANFVMHTRRRRISAPDEDCTCASCRDLKGATLWYHIITGLRRNEPAKEIADEWNKPRVDHWFWHKKLTAAGVRRILQQIRFIASGGKSRID